MARPKRVAVTEVGHWHALNDAQYLPVLAAAGVEIVGVSDPNLTVAQSVADRFGGKAFDDYRDLIEDTAPDFVVALGRHIDMPEIFRCIATAGIPFLMEKPWATNSEALQELEALVAERHVWVTAPFQFRHRLWARTGQQMVRNGELGAVSYMTFRMMRPSPERYVTLGSPWMLTQALSGGGALINLGSHGFDICRFITGEEPTILSAAVSNTIHKGDVEDYAMVTLQTPSSAIFNIEVGYAWPGNDGDRRFEIVGEKAAVFGIGEDVRIVRSDSEEILSPLPGFPGAYPAIIADCLDRIERGEPPMIEPHDCFRSLNLIQGAYKIARR